jgi:hypothetical protein
MHRFSFLNTQLNENLWLKEEFNNSYFIDFQLFALLVQSFPQLFQAELLLQLKDPYFFQKSILNHQRKDKQILNM